MLAKAVKKAIMKIFVCVKHVPDSAAKITIKEKNQFDESITFILNPYDEHAVEEAARVKKQVGDCEVIAVSVGKKDAENTLRSALAMGADRAILIQTNGRPDSIMTARALKAAIEQDGKPDLIFTGKESIDSEGFQTMYRLAAGLDMPVSSNVVAFSLEQDRAVLECEMEAGATGVVEMPLPCVIGTGKGLNKPSYPTLPAIMKARKKEVKIIDLKSLAIENPVSSMEILELKPAVEEREAIELKGPPQEAVGELIRILREEVKVLA
jgi:electron transfer flavoprotein beta subunit